jgi:5-methyltetrahydrofolate--homocysteine methyltransferase
MAIVDLGAVNPGEEISAELRARVEDAVLERRPDAAERLARLGASAEPK